MPSIPGDAATALADTHAPTICKRRGHGILRPGSLHYATMNEANTSAPVGRNPGVPGRRRADLMDPVALSGIGGLEFIARHVVEGFFMGLHRSPHRGFSAEFAEHRAYQAGDDLRYIDWRMYGRSDRFYVKQYEEETNLRAYLLLDNSLSMGWSSQPETLATKSWYAKHLLACIALVLLRQGDLVGFASFPPRDPGAAGTQRRAQAVAPDHPAPRAPATHRADFPTLGTARYRGTAAATRPDRTPLRPPGRSGGNPSRAALSEALRPRGSRLPHSGPRRARPAARGRCALLRSRDPR